MLEEAELEQWVQKEAEVSLQDASKHTIASALLGKLREASARVSSAHAEVDRAHAREQALRTECDSTLQRVANLRQRALSAEDDAQRASYAAQEDASSALLERDCALARVDSLTTRVAELEAQLEAHMQQSSNPPRMSASYSLHEWYGSRLQPMHSRVDAVKSLEGKTRSLSLEAQSERAERKRLERELEQQSRAVELRDSEISSLSLQLKSSDALELQHRAAAAEAKLEEEEAKCQRLMEQLNQVPTVNEQLQAEQSARMHAESKLGHAETRMYEAESKLEESQRREQHLQRMYEDLHDESNRREQSDREGVTQSADTWPETIKTDASVQTSELHDILSSNEQEEVCMNSPESLHKHAESEMTERQRLEQQVSELEDSRLSAKQSIENERSKNKELSLALSKERAARIQLSEQLGALQQGSHGKDTNINAHDTAVFSEDGELYTPSCTTSNAAGKRKKPNTLSNQGMEPAEKDLHGIAQESQEATSQDVEALIALAVELDRTRDDLQHKLERASKRVEVAEANEAEAREAMELAKKEAEEVRSQMNVEAQASASVQDEVEKWKREAERMENQALNEESARQDAAERAARAEAYIQQAAQEAHEADERANQARAECKTAKEEQARGEEQRKISQDELEAARKDLEAIAKEQQAVNAELTSTAKERDDLKNLLDQSRARENEANGKARAKAQEVEQIMESYQELSSENRRLHASTNHLARRVETAAREAESFKRERDEQADRANKAEEYTNTLLTDLQAYQLEAERLSRQLREMDQAGEEQSNEERKIADELHNARSAMNEVELARQEARRDAAAWEARANSLHAQLNDALSDAQSKKKQALSESARCRELESLLEKTRWRLHLKHTRPEQQEDQEQSKSTTETASSLRERSEALQKRCEALEEQVQILQRSLQHYQQQPGREGSEHAVSKADSAESGTVGSEHCLAQREREELFARIEHEERLKQEAEADLRRLAERFAEPDIDDNTNLPTRLRELEKENADLRQNLAETESTCRQLTQAAAKVAAVENSDEDTATFAIE